MEFKGNQDLTLKEIQNYAVHRVTSLPATAVIGQLALRTTDSTLLVYTSTGWKYVGNTEK